MKLSRTDIFFVGRFLILIQDLWWFRIIHIFNFHESFFIIYIFLGFCSFCLHFQIYCHKITYIVTLALSFYSICSYVTFILSLNFVYCDPHQWISTKVCLVCVFFKEQTFGFVVLLYYGFIFYSFLLISIVSLYLGRLFYFLSLTS